MSDSSNRRDIELRIRAQDLSTADLQRVAAAIKELSAAVGQETEAAKKGSIGVAELREQITKLEQAGKALTSIAVLVDRFKDLSGVVTANATVVEKAQTTLGAYRAQLEQSGDTSKTAQTKLNQYVRELTQAEARLAQNRTALEGVSAALAKSGVDTAALAQAERDLKVAADQVGTSLTTLNEAQLNYARNAREAKEAAAALREEQKQTATAAKAEAEAVNQASAARAKAAADLRTELSGRMQANRAQTASLENFNAETIRLTKDRQSAETRAARETARQTITEQQAKFDALNRGTVAFNAETARLARQRQETEAQALRGTINALRAPQAALGAAPIPGARGVRAPTGLFGLRPYELQNLSYQVNDIVSGIASGQRATQILAQQGGQVLQLFSRNLFDLIKYLPAISLGIAGVTLVVEGLIHSFRDQAALREFTGLLDLNANGARYDAQQLAALQHTVRDLGVSWKDSGDVIRQAVAAGLNQDKIKDYAQAARDLADVTGKSVPEAMKDLTDGTTHSIDAIIKLNTQFNFLSQTQFKTIQDLYAQGKQAEANALAFDILQGKVRRAAEEALTPFTKATRELSRSWNELLDALGRSGVIDSAARGLSSLAGALQSVAQGIRENPTLARDIAIVAGALSGAVTVGRFIPGPYGRAIGAVGGGLLTAAVTARGEPAAPSAPPPAPSEGGTFRVGPQVDLSTESLQQLSKILTQAAPYLPTGYTVEAISGRRPNAVVVGTGTPSEHSDARGGRAIDVRIVGPDGKPVEGSMGAGGPLYTMLDQAVAAAAAKLYPGVPIAVGSRFSKPDAGHYSIGGVEAQRQAGGGYATPTSANQIAGQQILTIAKEDLQLQYASNREAERKLELAKLLREAQAAGLKAGQDELGVDQQQEYIKIRIADYDARTQAADRDFQNEISRLRISDGKNAETIFQAGQAARAKALQEAKDGLISIAELNKRQREGEAEARAKFQQDERYAAEKKAILDQLASLSRQNSLKDTNALEKALEAVNAQYTAINLNLEKAARDFPGRSTEIQQLKEKAEALKAVALAQATLSSYETQAKTAASTRNTLIQTYTELEAAGEISIAEKERKIKAAYDLTTPSILAAVDALEKLIATDKTLSPDKIALYTAEIAKLRAEAKYVDPLFKGLKDTISNSFSTGVSTAFNTISESIGNAIAKTGQWKDVLVSVARAAANFFAQLLKDIANYLIKAEAAKIASSWFGADTGGSSGGGGFLSSIGKFFGFGGESGGGGEFIGGGDYGGGGDLVAAVLHSGGVVGRAGGVTRPVNRSWFDNAPRYHTGTLVGLAPDEHRAILKRGEEVLSQDNPRNIANMAKSAGGGGGLAIRNVLVMDKAQIPAAMAGAHGERVTVAHVLNNIATIRQAVKG